MLGWIGAAAIPFLRVLRVLRVLWVLLLTVCSLLSLLAVRVLLTVMPLLMVQLVVLIIVRAVIHVRGWAGWWWARRRPSARIPQRVRRLCRLTWTQRCARMQRRSPMLRWVLHASTIVLTVLTVWGLY